MVANDEAKRHLVAGAKNERTMAYAELVAGICDIVALHEEGVERKLVRKALDTIVNSTVEGKGNTNPLARITARVLLAQINDTENVRDILSSDLIAMGDASAAIGALVREAHEIVEKNPDGKNFRKTHELRQTVTLLAASSMEIWMLKQCGTDNELLKDALGLIIEHGPDERKKLAARAMLSEIS